MCVMDSLYIMIMRFSKYLTRVCVALGISLLIFVYFITLNGRNTNDAFDRESSIDHDVPLNVFGERYERDEHAASKGKVQ